MYEQLDVGEQATVHVECIDTAGTLADPTSLDLAVTDPAGNVTNVALLGLTHDATGLYSYSFTVTAAGVWTYTFTASGNDVNFVTTEYLVVGQPTSASGPCDLWITPAEVFGLAPASTVPPGDRDYGLADLCAQAASRLLYVLSRQRYPGICRHVVRPCRRCRGWSTPGWWQWNESWGTCGCGAQSYDACGCGTLDAILLGAEPVLGVTEVRIDGAVFGAAGYRVDEDRWLVRTDGEYWPTCQDLAANPATDEDTFQVTYLAGRTPPADGKLAAMRLAGDLYTGGTGGDCALPPNLVSRVRQGDTLEFGAQPAQDLTAGLVGLTEVDRFLSAEQWRRAHQDPVTVSAWVGPGGTRTGP